MTSSVDEVDLFWPTTSMASALAKTLDRIEENGRRGGRAVSTGVTDLDRQTSGLPKGRVTVIAGVRGVGTTALALRISSHVAMVLKLQVLYMATRDSIVSLTERLVGYEAQVPSERIDTGRLRRTDWSSVGRATERLSDAPIFFSDHPFPSIDQLMVSASRLQRDGRFGLVVIDRLPGLRGWSDHCSTDRREIADGLSSMAETLDVPVVVLSRLNRRSSLQKSQVVSDDVQGIAAMERIRHFILVSQAPTVESEPSTLTIRLDIEDPVRKTVPVVVKWGGSEATEAARCDLASASEALD